MKAKKDRFLLAILLIFSLLMASCNGLFSGDSKEESDWAEPTISLSVTNWNARTAFPEMTVDKITEFKLTGTKEGASEPSLTETWTGDTSETAYAKMSGDAIPISLGRWIFTLQAWAKDGETELASYEKTLDPKEITGGENSLQFDLILKEVNVATSAGTGTLEIAITLDGNAQTQVKAITGTLLKKDRTSASDKKNVSGNKYTVEGVEAGVYIAQIEFYGDEEKKVLLGNWLEAVNINSLGAKSSIKISDLDEPFDITYKAAVLGQDNFSDFTSNTNQTKYTRRNNFTFTNPTKDSCTFLKWVDITSNTGSGSTTTAGDSFIDTPATTGLNKSVGNKTLCALFISNNDLADITSVELSGLTGETAKVGSTITATAKAGESNYAGAVSKWIWYYVDGSAETEITTVSTGCTATSTYTVEPKYYGKKIKARVVPKYDVTKSGSTVTSVALNSSDTKFTESAEKDISKGTLNADAVSIKYTNAATPVRGTSLASTDFAIKEGSLKDASKSDWTYSAGNTTDYQITVTSTGCNAPTVESGNITTGIKFSVKVKGIGEGFVDAYEDLTVSKEVFVNVKYETPTAETASLPALDTTNDYAISYHKMKFTQASTTLTTQGKSSPMQYRLGASGSWVDISTSEFGPISANTDIYLRYKSIGTKDSNGYIEESDAFNWQNFDYTTASGNTDSNSGLGKKIVLGSVALSGTAKICGTLTATASPNPTTNTEGINFLDSDFGSITWTWKAGGETLTSETTNSETSTLLIKEAWRTKCNGKKVTVEAEYSYKKANPSSPEKVTKSTESETVGTSASVLSKDTASLTYTEIAEVGSTLSVDKLTKAGNFKNVLGETVAWTGSACEINSTAPESNGTVNVTVKIPGYPDITVPVNVTVKQAAPSIPGGGGSGGGEGGGSGGSSYSLLDNHTEIIPYGHIRFMADMRADPPGGKHALVEYEYRKVGSANWYPIRNTLYFGYTDDIPLYADVMNGDEFFKNSDEIQLRFKRKAVGGVDGKTTIYYSEIDGKWKIGEYYYTDDEVKGMNYKDITEASDPSIAMSIDDLVGSYKALNGGITVKNDGDLKVSVSGKTISVEDATSFTDFAWYVDGTKIPDASGSSYTLSGSLADKYTVRVEAKKGGQIHSATISVNGN